MLHFESIRELRNGKRYNTLSMSKNNGLQSISAMVFHDINENEMPEIRAITRKEANEQNTSFIAPLTQQRGLNQLLQRLSISAHSNHHSKAKTDAGDNAHG